jgi:hypothetical protein
MLSPLGIPEGLTRSSHGADRQRGYIDVPSLQLPIGLSKAEGLCLRQCSWSAKISLGAHFGGLGRGVFTRCDPVCSVACLQTVTRAGLRRFPILCGSGATLAGPKKSFPGSGVLFLSRRRPRGPDAPESHRTGAGGRPLSPPSLRPLRRGRLAGNWLRHAATIGLDRHRRPKIPPEPPW